MSFLNFSKKGSPELQNAALQSRLSILMVEQQPSSLILGKVLQVPALFKIANSKDTPEIPESISKEGKDFLSLCLKRDPAQRPSASQLLGHPFVNDHQAIRAAKCRETLLINGLSSPVEARHKKVFSSFFKLSAHFNVCFPRILDISRYYVLLFPSTSKKSKLTF